jgi:tetratricopeptide (TPR) repeat protein
MRAVTGGVLLCAALGCTPASSAPPRSPALAPTSACAQPSEPAPSHRALWEHAKQLERQEQWAEMEATLARAEELAPGFATYPYKRGHALTMLGFSETEREARQSLFLRAIAPFGRCLAADPAFAECHHFLAEALQATGELQAALEHYDRAIRIDPSVAYFYPPYVEALILSKQYDAAAAVVNEGIRLVPLSEDSQRHLYAMRVLSFLIYQARNDRAGMIRALENALAAHGDAHPEILFNLGATHATATPPDPRARELLGQFYRRVCHGAAAARYAAQCELTQSLLQKLPR